MELLAEFLGAVVGVFVLTRVLQWALRGPLGISAGSAIGISAVLVLIIVVAVARVSFEETVYVFGPALVLWITVDFVRARRAGSSRLMKPWRRE